MGMIYEQPPALNGDAAAQLNQLYRYLFKLSEQLNASLETTDKQYAKVLQTKSGSGAASGMVTPQEDQQYRELRSLIIKTADIVNQNMDRVVTQLRSEYQAISEEWGEFEQNIERTIIDTAKNTIEQFDYSELIEGIDKTVMGGTTQYSIASLGYIKRGIIGFDEQNFPIYGIAVGTQLEGKTVIKDGKEYTVIDTTHNLATYTSDRISFWVNGVERAYFTADTLYVRRIKVIEGIDIGDDFSIELNDDSGLTVGEKLGAAINISKNEVILQVEKNIESKAAKDDVNALDERVSAAEQKITADAIVSTVTASTSYKTLSGNVTTAQSTADAAKTAANTNASSISALTSRVITTESQIKQKADSIELSVLRTEVEGIEVGGTNLMRGTDWTQTRTNAATQAEVKEFAISPEHYPDIVGKELTMSLYIRAPGARDQSLVSNTQTNNRFGGHGTVHWIDSTGVNASVKTTYPFTGLLEHVSDGERFHQSATITPPSGCDTIKEMRFTVQMYAKPAAGNNAVWEVGKPKLEFGNKATDWSPAPEDPAKALSTGTTVLIDDERFNVRTKTASFDIIDDASGEDEELVRIDSDGLTAKDGTFETVHSDSVVGTQAGTTFGPANAGELQAFLDNLSNRCLLGDVNIDVRNITGGNFTVKGLSGSGQLVLNGNGTGVLNSFAIQNCHARVRLYNMTFSTTGTALDVYCAAVYLNGVTLNANVGVQMDFAQAALYNCAGTCTTVCYSGPESSVHIYGSTIPYGQPGMNGGEVYSSLAFANPPSAVETPTVTSTILAATSTRTWNGGWISGNVLYQGKVGSDGQLRRGCMWFDLSAIAGKTIVSATLTLKRVDGIGGGGSVAVGIYGTTAASASGTPAVGTKYASVSLANGATKSVDVTAAVQALANGSIRGLMVYDTQTGTYSSKNYTYGYCKLYGSSDGAKPVLSVTYK